jgi:chitinase
MLNVNLDPKYIVGGFIFILFSGALFLAGQLLGNEPKEIVCKDFIKQVVILNTQVKAVELSLSESKHIYSLECVNREKEICSDLIKKTTDNIKKLRCRICKAQGVK